MGDEGGIKGGFYRGGYIGHSREEGRTAQEVSFPPLKVAKHASTQQTTNFYALLSPEISGCLLTCRSIFVWHGCL